MYSKRTRDENQCNVFYCDQQTTTETSETLDSSDCFMKIPVISAFSGDCNETLK